MFGFFKKKKKESSRKVDNFKVSVVMPVYLGDYEGCADERIERFKAAVISFTQQKYKNKELIIVSDGCDIALDTYNKYLVYDNVIFTQVEKQPLFSGNVRQHGVENATGDIICYLDSDDMMGVNHLSSIIDGFKKEVLSDWIFYNDLILTPDSRTEVREVYLIEGIAGTSSIAHRKECNASWKGCDGYGHDWKFIEQLIDNHTQFHKSYGAEYYVCHLRGSV